MEILTLLFCLTPFIGLLFFATFVHYFIKSLKKYENEKFI